MTDLGRAILGIVFSFSWADRRNGFVIAGDSAAGEDVGFFLDVVFASDVLSNNRFECLRLEGVYSTDVEDVRLLFGGEPGIQSKNILHDKH